MSEEAVIQAYLIAFTAEQGSLVLEDLKRAFYESELFIPGHTRCCDLAYAEGQRSVVIRILEMMDDARNQRVPPTEDWGSLEESRNE